MSHGTFKRVQHPWSLRNGFQTCAYLIRGEPFLIVQNFLLGDFGESCICDQETVIPGSSSETLAIDGPEKDSADCPTKLPSIPPWTTAWGKLWENI
ncbi:hypothetical protein CEXT_750091 [Caerostris extrusa]|uniref:Uncharacterized protein n=1 Tax=Caerostris extrusa TaxID=172846 RepID=A0AAV4NU60_CAEEX|nr:hypothetical protein CEXT_750091 [Caerostris extrusa]